MPTSLQRLSTVVQTVLSLLECPVCLESITPPAMQCQNGHLLCVNCRIRAEKCPVCRDRYYPRPALIAEQLHVAITSAFNLCQSEVKVRQRIFGRSKSRKQIQKTLRQCDCKESKKESISAATLNDKNKSSDTMNSEVNNTCYSEHNISCICNNKTNLISDSKVKIDTLESSKGGINDYSQYISLRCSSEQLVPKLDNLSLSLEEDGINNNANCQINSIRLERKSRVNYSKKHDVENLNTPFLNYNKKYQND